MRTINYSSDQFTKLLQHLPTLLKYYGIYNLETLSNYSVTLLHDMHFRCYTNTNYPLDNGNVLRNESNDRLIPLDTSFMLYPDRCNDSHIETAMKNAFKILAANFNKS